MAKEKKAKGASTKKPAYKMSGIYTVSGDSLERKNKLCPKCNVFMANHKNRKVCGKCGYSEFS